MEIKERACTKCGATRGVVIEPEFDGAPWCEACLIDLGKRVLARRRRKQRGEMSTYVQEAESAREYDRERILEAFLVAPGLVAFTRKDLEAFVGGTSPRTFQRRLSELVESGAVVQHGAGARVVYVHAERLQQAERAAVQATKSDGVVYVPWMERVMPAVESLRVLERLGLAVCEQDDQHRGTWRINAK